MEEKKEILKLLQEFQAGYLKRNPKEAQSFVDKLFVPGEEVSIIGTSATSTESEEWCSSREKVIKIIKEDWEEWGDLSIFPEEGIFHIDKVGAYVGLTGLIRGNIDTEKYLEFRLGWISKLMEKEGDSSRGKLLKIVSAASSTLKETYIGEEYSWPIRLTFIIVRYENEWRIKHIHFSYPVTDYPQVRLE